jgi:succinate dehydrogenase / fumarate reductase flavoprotein subunit
MMNDLVGIIRDGQEMKEAIEKLENLKQKTKNIGVDGGKQFNPGWHLSLDLQNMLLVSESIAKSALVREESRGGHTRNDFPTMDKNWRSKHVICSWNGSKIETRIETIVPMPKELAELFEKEELSKYMLPEELTQLGMGA